MSKKFFVYLSLSILTFISLSLSFIIRLNVRDLVPSIGLIVGEIWIFYKRYGNDSIVDFFYRIEYPVGFILIHKLVIFINSALFKTINYETFLLSHAVIMIPLAIGFVLMIYYLSNLLEVNRFLTVCYILLSPTFFIASTTNYDLFPAFFTILATTLIIKNKIYYAFLFLAFGTVVKIYPVFLLPIFILFAYSKKFTQSQIIKSVLIFVFTISLINLPYVINNFSLWLYPYLFQLQNPQRYDPNTISYFFVAAGFERFRWLIFPIFVFISWLIAYFFYLARIMNNKNFVLLLYFTTFSIVFANQVYTPQYLLWFLPFTALTHIPVFFCWLFFDLINSLILFFGSQLSSGNHQVLNQIFSITIINFVLLYAALLYKITLILRKATGADLKSKNMKFVN